MLSSIIEKIENELSYIPIADEEKQNIVDIINCFSPIKNNITATTMPPINDMLYYLYMNIDIDNIEEELSLQYKNIKNITEEELQIQKTIVSTIITIINQIREIINKNKQYKRFYLNLFENILNQTPICGRVTFEDENWEIFPNDKGNQKYSHHLQHKEYAHIVKDINTNTDEEIIRQLDYFIFENNDGECYLSSDSVIDITNTYSWVPHNVLINAQLVQTFVHHFNKHGVFFDQLEKSQL